MALLVVESGFPLNKRDNFGNRGINLVDQNYEFLCILKKKLKATRGKEKKFVRHPNRHQEESRFSVS